MSLLQIKNISKTYNKKVLDDISFNVENNEIISIVGKSGSGKSTIFNIVTKLEEADSGEILLDGHTIKLGDVAYMQQKDLLLPYYTVLENCMLPLKIKKDSNAKQKTLELLSDLDLLSIANLYPNELSGGMRQRVAFVRTLLTGKKIILLDEPFSALDAFTKKQLHSWYINLTEKYNLTTLLITHDIEEALSLSNKIFALSNCRIIKMFNVPQNKQEYVNSLQFLEDKKNIYELLAE